MPRTSIPNSRLRYPNMEPPKNGAMVDLPCGMRWIRLPVPGGLSHINVWLIPDDGGWTLVDTGMGIDPVNAAWEGLLEQLGDDPIRRIIVTHHHPDHFGQAAWLAERCNVEVWMTDAEFDSALGPRHIDPRERASHRRQSLEKNGMSISDDIAPFLSGKGYQRIISGIPEKIRPIRDGELVTIGDHKWQIIVTAGHANGHAALYCDAIGTLISGDHVLPTISPNISLWSEDSAADPLEDYLSSFARFRELPAETLVSAVSRAGLSRAARAPRRTRSRTSSRARDCARGLRVTANRRRSYPCSFPAQARFAQHLACIRRDDGTPALPAADRGSGADLRYRHDPIRPHNVTRITGSGRAAVST